MQNSNKMDSKHTKILYYLSSEGVGIYRNISPILLEMYPNVNTKSEDAPMMSQIVNALLNSMKKSNLIEVQHYKIGVGNTTNGYDWIDNISIMASITQFGLDALSNEMAKPQAQKLNEATILLNESLRDVNIETIKSYAFNRRMQIFSIILATISTAFIGVTIYQTAKDKTERKLEGIQTEIQLLSKQLDKQKTYQVMVIDQKATNQYKGDTNLTNETNVKTLKKH